MTVLDRTVINEEAATAIRWAMGRDETARKVRDMTEYGSGEELEEFCIGRAGTYRLFASLVDREIDGEGARHLASLEVTAAANGEDVPTGLGHEGADGTNAAEAAACEGERMVAHGFSIMAQSVAAFDADVRNDLACEYARIFLAAGTYEGQTAVPYESVYTSEERLLMQDARDQVRALFRASDVMPSTDGSIPDDYLVFELEFMALLNERVAEAYQASDADGAEQIAQQARSFFVEHIANWVGEMLSDVDDVAGLSFYHGFAQAFRGFLICEERDTQDLVRYVRAARAA